MARNARRYPGVVPHGDSWRIRPMIGGKRLSETYPTQEAAVERILELKRMKAAGVTPSAAAAAEQTLADAARSLLTRKQVSGRRHQLRARGVEWWERSLRPWTTGDLAATPLSLLRREKVEDVILARAAKAPTSARNELQALKATLTYVGNRGSRFDERILHIEPVQVTVRRRRALTVEQVETLASCAPEYGKRLLLLGATTGLRSGELFSLTDDRVDLRGAAITIPAELAKERRAKVIPLTAPEVALLREQLMARAPGTRLVFPTKTGKQWRRSMFHRLVWTKACERAAAYLRQRDNLPPEAVTPFCDLTPHDLRATAVTLMREAGMTANDAAARVGHADHGKLITSVYDQGDLHDRARKALDTLAPAGLLAPG